ncbi:MAG TPA: ParA family protein [Abditibacteriaceae bacterium]|jgi:chromosome partitioning protein
MIISVINQKGGVGKTTTAVNLAVSLAQWGHQTLLVDLDPQGNATSGVGLSSVPSPSLYECLIESAAHTERTEENTEITVPVAVAGTVPRFSVVGSSTELAGADVEIGQNPRRDNLRSILRAMNSDYDFIVIDTPPSVSLLTVNALVAADRLIIPVQCEYYALEGLGQLLRTLERVRKNLNPHVSVMGLVRTMYDGRLGLSAQVSAELERHFSRLLFSTMIPRNVRLAEAPSHGKPIALYDRRSPGANAYQKLALEVIKRSDDAKQQISKESE